MEFGLGVASSITENLLSQFTKVSINELGKTYNVDQNLRSLVNMVTNIQKKVNELGNEELAKAEWKSWVQHLIGILFEAEDVIDTINLAIEMHDQEAHQQRLMVRAEQQMSTWFSRFISELKTKLTKASKKRAGNVVLSFKKVRMAHKIDDLLSEFQTSKNELDNISEGLSKRHGKVNSSELDSAQLGGMRLSTFCQPHVNLTETREKEKVVIIKDYLLNPSLEGIGVSIYGMAGSGKTTLARSIQRDSEIKEHFDHLIWGSVPGNFSFSSKALIFLHDEEGRPLVHVTIKSLLQRKGKTLLVLDDIWNIQPDWKDSEFAQSHRSKMTLLITTRDPRVAKTAKIHSYHIKGLSHIECKELIKGESPSYALEHDYIMEILAEKCCGLPLVAKKLGQAIESMSDNTNGISPFKVSYDLWDLGVFRDAIFPALKFNEPGLPHDMSKCVVYLTLFPPGYKFKEDELAQLWFAEGFLPPDDDLDLGFSMIKARNYIDEMYWRSILQVSNLGLRNTATTYEMHEYLRGFARYLAFNTCHQVEHGNSINLSNQVRHLSICCQTIPDTILETIIKCCKRLRTFLLLHKSGTNISKIPESFFSDLHYLRVVNLSNSPITCLPRSIRKLNHLRSLDVSNTHLQTLNDKICDIYSLQILRLKNCIKLLGLPENIWKLVNLVSLEFDIKCGVPLNIGSLTKLQALEEYVVEKYGKDITQLENMNHLQGSIRIKKLENVRSGLEATRANLIQKPHLEGLELYWTKTWDPQCSDNHAEEILSKLEPSEWLQELKLMCYNGGTFPHWLGSHKRNLKKIHLYDCPNIDDLSVFWQLPYLNNLFVDSLSKIETIDRNFLGNIASSKRFLKLERLEFRNMENLHSWEEMVTGDFPSLLYLIIKYCPKLNAWPSSERLPKLISANISRCGSTVSP